MIAIVGIVGLAKGIMADTCLVLITLKLLENFQFVLQHYHLFILQYSLRNMITQSLLNR